MGNTGLACVFFGGGRSKRLVDLNLPRPLVHLYDHYGPVPSSKMSEIKAIGYKIGNTCVLGHFFWGWGVGVR